jgi:hypothetical protein
MVERIAELLIKIEDKGYIGAGPLRLEADINWQELKILFAAANKPAPKPVIKVAPKKAGKK